MLPQEFLDMIQSYRAPQLAGLGEALLTPAEVSVRVNPLKRCRPADGFERVPWCPEGIYLSERHPFTFDPAIHQGLYYVQDASSMFIVHVLRSLLTSDSPVRYLDACAAPGGKTTAAISALPAGSIVTANEYSPLRCAVLRENLAKWGYPLVSVTSGSAEQFARQPESFDVIAADVPCSGEGMMRKEPEAVAQWSPALIEQCAARQRDITDALWTALAPGGLLIYSTCTFNRRENEEIIHYLVDTYGAESVPVPIDPSWGISPGIDTPYSCYRFIPGLTRGEGLFMAVLRKPGSPSVAKPARKENRKKSAPKTKAPDISCTKQWLNFQADISVSPDGEVIAAPALVIGQVKGRDIIPSQQLAMSTALRRDAFPECDVDAATAIDYLKHNAVSLPDDTPRGFVLLTYAGRPLGFVKNLGNRANNLYPSQWRITSTHALPAPSSFLSAE